MEAAHHVGIDISKGSVSLCRLAAGQKAERTSFKTDPEGMQRLVAWIKPNDLVALEAGNLAFALRPGRAFRRLTIRNSSK